MTGVVHLQHAILLADRPQDVVVVHHHDRGIDRVPPVLMRGEEDFTALELGDGQNRGIHIHCSEGIAHGGLISNVFCSNILKRAIQKIKGEGSGSGIEKAGTDSGILLKCHRVEGELLNDRNGIMVENNIRIGVQNTDTHLKYRLESHKLESRNLVKRIGGLLDEVHGDVE